MSDSTIDLKGKHLIPFLGKNNSGTNALNVLFKTGKVFIMDNHLAASWCWMQEISPNDQYSLLHIDKHYDLLNSQLELWLKNLREQNFDFKKMSIDELINLRYESSDKQFYQIFRWDNYIQILISIFPELIDRFAFFTHKIGSTNHNVDICERDFYALPDFVEANLDSEVENKWIVNIDIDYFFCDVDGQHFQVLTDEYIKILASKLKLAWSNISVLTIALSPEMCGGWENSVRVARNIAKCLDSDFPESL